VYFVKKKTDSIELPLGMMDRVGPRNDELDGDGVQIPLQKGAIFGGGGWAAQCSLTYRGNAACTVQKRLNRSSYTVWNSECSRLKESCIR